MTRKRTPSKSPATATTEQTKRAPRAKPKPRPRAKQAPAPAPAPAPTPPPKRRRRRIVLAVFGAVLLAVLPAAAVAAFLLNRVDESPDQARAAVPVTVSAEALARLATSREAPIYWAGPLPSRDLELTDTSTGTFVRYLPVGVDAGDDRASFTTIATYPMSNSYETAVRRGDEPGMASREAPGGAVAVWSRAEPTSVYLAYPRVAQLVEVYAPRPAEARRLALSGRVRPAGQAASLDDLSSRQQR